MWICTHSILKCPRVSENSRSHSIFFHRLLPEDLPPAPRPPHISQSLPGTSYCCIPQARISATLLSKRTSVSPRVGNSAHLVGSPDSQPAKLILLPCRSNGSSIRRCWRASIF